MTDLIPQLKNKTVYISTLNTLTVDNYITEFKTMQKLYDRPTLRAQRRKSFQQWFKLMKPKEVIPAAPFEEEVMYGEITVLKSFENLTKTN